MAGADADAAGKVKPGCHIAGIKKCNLFGAAISAFLNNIRVQTRALPQPPLLCVWIKLNQTEAKVPSFIPLLDIDCRAKISWMPSKA